MSTYIDWDDLKEAFFGACGNFPECSDCDWRGECTTPGLYRDLEARRVRVKALDARRCGCGQVHAYAVCPGCLTEGT